MDTYLRYTMLHRDLPQAMSQTAKDPILARETEYFKKNYSKVETVDDLLNDYRLYNYMMKAMGMEDMAYAKGMVRRVLTEGTTDRRALANTLNDSRFKDLAEAFSFNKDGTKAGTFDWSAELLDHKVVRYTNVPGEKVSDTERLADYFRQKIPRDVVVASQLVLDPALFRVASVVFNIPKDILNSSTSDQADWLRENVDMKDFDQAIELRDLTDQYKDKVKEQEEAFTKLITDRYVRENFEANEGADNNGVRLALVFKRTAPDISDAYEIIASPALYQVVKTVLGLPASINSTNVDYQAKLINEKFDIKKFKDPEEVDKFVKKFVSIYDVMSDTSPSPTVQIFSNNANAGISANVLAASNALKLGG